MDNIYQIVANNGFVVFADEDTRTLITWNGSATFLWWSAPYENFFFENRDVMTRYEITDVKQAEQFAEQWFEEEMAVAK